MDIISGTILGVVQGLTEFLPISSSGHLILAREVLGISGEHGLSVDAVLQLATVLAIGIYFWRDLVRLAVTTAKLVVRKPVEARDRTMVLAIVIGTIPAALLGFLLEDFMETVFRSPLLVVGTLVAGSVLMWGAEAVAKQGSSLTWKKGLIVGLFQSLALMPGMSRSGSTISGGLIVGLKREDAARFSFLLAFPIIAGSGVLKLSELISEGAMAELGGGLVAGFIAAFLVGMAAIHFLLKFLRKHTLAVFVWYRIVLACVVAVALIAT
ncbi:MAG: undecaprenyl-diphosphatase UppP [Patescibacteria group bacterium]|nr:undecaprenyl-diphosphatase UppP [Patescibacteria group bacterium]